jgi:carotenoid 1,2-hydratase
MTKHFDPHQTLQPASAPAEAAAAPRPAPFDTPVPDNGYRWWYLDATDHDSGQALVIIVFVGSVFSPYYYRARQQGRGQADNFCAINVALYGEQGKKLWAMTERRAGSISRSADQYRLGPSQVRWQDGSLCFDINERCTPFGQRLQGKVRATPQVTHPGVYTLDQAGKHQWTPWAPSASVEVDFSHPALRWQGSAYIDGNAGDEPLETAFVGWNWSRSAGEHGTSLYYRVQRLDGSEHLLSFEINAAGQARPCPAGTVQALPRAGWGVAREAAGHQPLELTRTLEDTPFYPRNLLREQAGNRFEVVHESLSMQRFEKAWVRSLLPFRMPREWPRRG